jgi:hypothetical protein
VIASPELDGVRLALPAATRNFAVDGYVPKPHWRDCQSLGTRVFTTELILQLTMYSLSFFSALLKALWFRAFYSRRICSLTSFSVSWEDYFLIWLNKHPFVFPFGCLQLQIGGTSCMAHIRNTDAVFRLVLCFQKKKTMPVNDFFLNKVWFFTERWYMNEGELWRNDKVVALWPRKAKYIRSKVVGPFLSGSYIHQTVF